MSGVRVPGNNKSLTYLFNVYPPEMDTFGFPFSNVTIICRDEHVQKWSAKSIDFENGNVS